MQYSASIAYIAYRLVRQAASSIAGMSYDRC
jgi:hypothetical protein